MGCDNAWLRQLRFHPSCCFDLSHAVAAEVTDKTLAALVQFWWVSAN